MRATRMKPRRREAEAKTTTLKQSPAAPAPLTPQQQAARTTFLVTLACGLAGGLLLWASFPPLNWWPVAWLAPLPWLYLIARPQPMTRWAYAALWFAGLVHWLLLLQGIRLAHILLYGGWFSLSAYLGIYLPLFIGLSRVAVHRLRIPIIITAPIIWVGLELIRGYLITGFSLCLLSHTQVFRLSLLQIADIFGAYGVCFVMMLVTACIFSASRPVLSRWLPELASHQTAKSDLDAMFGPVVGWGSRYGQLAIAAVFLAATLTYGYVRLSEARPGQERQPLTVALIQGSHDVHIDMGEKEARERMDDYIALTDQACRDNAALDLVIWPESMFRHPEFTIGPGGRLPRSSLPSFREAQAEFDTGVRTRAVAINSRGASSRDGGPAWFWFCTTTVQFGHDRASIFNSAILADEYGRVVNRYHKMHGVMFGEYVPFAKYLPWLYDLIPIGGMEEGTSPAAAEVKGLIMSPSICFESTIPHLIRRQVTEASRAGNAPDVLVNLTNDGWFKGSSILDHHLRCSVFRAIENRKPVLIAANTGFSAHIDGNGKVLVQGPRRDKAVLVAKVHADGRGSLYHILGDIPAGLCALSCLGLLAVGLISRWKSRARGK